ncbi:hypothetical protein GCM10027040_13150 [Halomonas shantousis]
MNDNYAEGQKLIIETYKHLTTLSSGSMILISTFLDNSYKNAVYKHLVANSLILFGISICFSITSILILCTSIMRDRNICKSLQKTGYISVFIASISFVGGIACIGKFFTENFN